ncbi:unnamed protein product, partial [Polarella glacialis]
ELAARLRGVASILSYEYVGYSLSRLEGFAASEQGCYRSIDAAWTYLTRDLRVAPGDIVLWGRSIGSGPTVDLACRPLARGCAGVVLQCPIASGGRVLLGQDSALLWLAKSIDIFVNVDKIGLVDCPVAIMHGTADSVVPLCNGEELFRSSKRPFRALWLDGYDHNTLPSQDCAEYTLQFLEMLKSNRASQVGRSSATLFCA